MSTIRDLKKRYTKVRDTTLKTNIKNNIQLTIANFVNHLYTFLEIQCSLNWWKHILAIIL